MATGEMAREVVLHELTHYIRGSAGYKAYYDSAMKAAYNGDEDTMNRDRESLRKQYASKNILLDEEGLDDELAARATERIIEATNQSDIFDMGSENLIYDLLGKLRSFVGRVMTKLMGFIKVVKDTPQKKTIRKTIHNLRYAIEHAENWNPNNAGADRTQYAVGKDGRYDYSKPFHEQVEDWFEGKIPSTDALVIGETPDILRRIGFSNLPMTYNQAHMARAFSEQADADHAVSKEFMKQLPQLLADPIAVIGSETNEHKSVVVIVSGVVNGHQVVAPVYMNSQSKVNNFRINSNNVASVYEKREALIS